MEWFVLFTHPFVQVVMLVCVVRLLLLVPLFVQYQQERKMEQVLAQYDARVKQEPGKAVRFDYRRVGGKLEVRTQRRGPQTGYWYWRVNSWT